MLQSHKQRGLTDVDLLDVLSARQACPQAGKAQAARRRLSRRVLGLLRANARGRFRTRGHYAAVTVRGTMWSVTDRCDGTLTRVTRGVVVVRDLLRRRDITLRGGKSYLARAPGG